VFSVARRRRKLPERYASEFLQRAKRGWFSDSIGWEEFAALMHERESFTLRAYNSLQLNRSGHLATPAITSSLRRLGLPATEENASAMLRYLGRAQDGYISYGEFRNFLLLLPPEQVRETDPSVLWFEAATFVQLRAPAVAAGASGVALLKAALAGALASGSSTAFMHPLDTLKTRVQASVGRAPGLRGLGRMIPELGARRLYLGIIPAVTGAATSHGIRTASYEWARVALAPLLALGLPGVSDTAIQGIASGFGTFLGTGTRPWSERRCTAHAHAPSQCAWLADTAVFCLRPRPSSAHQACASPTRCSSSACRRDSTRTCWRRRALSSAAAAWRRCSRAPLRRWRARCPSTCLAWWRTSA
jgi:hypothetical protein